MPGLEEPGGRILCFICKNFAVFIFCFVIGKQFAGFGGNKYFFIFTIIIITTTFTLSNILYFAWADNTIPIVSTRGHFDKLTGDLISTQLYNPLDNEIVNSICMRNEEVIVYVHGVWTT